jgi:hypothetical protein
MQKTTKLPAVHRPGRLPGNLRTNEEGERPKRLSQRQIEDTAQYFIRTDCSNLRNAVLELLYQFVSLTEATLFRLVAEQIEISQKATSFRARMNAYVRDGLIEPLSRGVIKQALRAGMPHPEKGSLRAYRLGSVGVEIARFKFVNETNVPLTVAENEISLAHDLICAEAMFRLQQLWAEIGPSNDNKTIPGYIKVHGPRAISIWDAENNKALLEPDGLLIKYGLDDAFLRSYIVEFHNTNAQMHVENKIAKYERLASPTHNGLWQTWGLDVMPIVLVLYRQDVTLTHYQEQLRKIAYKGIQAIYISMALAHVWTGPLQLTQIQYQTVDDQPSSLRR